MDKCLKCEKKFRHYKINFKPEPMYNKMYQFIPVTMCAWCRHNIAERFKKKESLDLEYYLFNEYDSSNI